ncbi:hypothetical protein CC1G_13236 [Coprinopsis cinerea okayama7|uniref:Uncharacterized protein n=1 Tax=Coprinopsis cinerea (strain Okayama-7 / 130 / ATCC MYA-4618 / FGSC 9003) TaxID=240176 RepID=A8NT11_COPC7|nr:hypothetical protein CC1G_13236 [Coprinopsis cinerea okayama7\|eukprot:XP_001836133.2 hypothetical protein CC1G_13236 [Coprinopsis cinerea okayama7\
MRRKLRKKCVGDCGKIVSEMAEIREMCRELRKNVSGIAEICRELWKNVLEIAECVRMYQLYLLGVGKPLQELEFAEDVRNPGVRNLLKVLVMYSKRWKRTKEIRDLLKALETPKRRQELIQGVGDIGNSLKALGTRSRSQEFIEDIGHLLREPETVRGLSFLPATYHLNRCQGFDQGVQNQQKMLGIH